MPMHLRAFLFLGIIPGLLIGHTAFAQEDQEVRQLRVDGRVNDGENKLAGAEVVVYRGNDPVEQVVADKAGRFRVWLGTDAVYGLEFRHAGFVAKRICIDARLPKPRPGIVYDFVPMAIAVTLLEKSRFDGAPTDDLDFPFAFIRYNKKTFSFEPDAEYTMGMQRVNGALLLMAARSDME